MNYPVHALRKPKKYKDHFLNYRNNNSGALINLKLENHQIQTFPSDIRYWASYAWRKLGSLAPRVWYAGVPSINQNSKTQTIQKVVFDNIIIRQDNSKSSFLKFYKVPH